MEITRKFACAGALALGLIGLQTTVFAQDESWKKAIHDPAGIAEDLREEVISFPVKGADGTVSTLVGTIFRPAGKGPFPIVILSHGAPANPEERRIMGRYRVLSPIRALLGNGFSVFIPMRRGYGSSEGAYMEGFGPCPSARFDVTGTESTRDIRAGIDWLKTQPDLDTRSIILIGQSAGGFASLAASSEGIEGIVAAINLSGGRGGNGRTGIPCNVKAMTDVMAQYGGRSRVPTLWFYVENDKYFAPEIAKTWFEAWKSAGGQGTLVLHPPFANDGHLLFYYPEGDAIWIGAMKRFLKERGLTHLAF